MSVVVTTYQHKDFIAQCLDSILIQKTNFAFEIILGEDESTDGTIEICQKYAKEHPHIRLFLRSRNDVIHINGKPSGKYNTMQCLDSCRGKYVAICEGDDYWTDPSKLQKQVDYLESHEETSMCFHNVSILKNGKLEANPIWLRKNLTESKTFTINDIAEQNFINTCSVMYKISVIKSIPTDVYKKAACGDYMLHITAAQQGNIAFIAENMGVYRIHDGGVWTGAEMRGERFSTEVKYLKLLISHYKNEPFLPLIKASLRTTYFVELHKQLRIIKNPLCLSLIAKCLFFYPVHFMKTFFGIFKK